MHHSFARAKLRALDTVFNRRFLDAVRQRLINLQAAGPAGASADNRPRTFAHDDVVAFVDLQNLHYFLKENARVPATQVHIPDLLREFAASHGLRIRDINVFTGIHDARREPQRHEAMANRVRWLERNGVRVTTLPLSYYTCKTTGQVRAQEKGVDVLIGAELLRAVTAGLRRAIVVTQDKDLAQAIRVAREMAEEVGDSFEAYSMELHGTEWEPNGKCGMHGVAHTQRLPIDVKFIERFVREDRRGGMRANSQDVAESA